MIDLRALPIAPGEGHLAGRKLLEEMVREVTGQPMPPIAVGPRGKPCFPGSDFHFPISHSKAHVFCALSHTPIGTARLLLRWQKKSSPLGSMPSGSALPIPEKRC